MRRSIWIPVIGAFVATTAACATPAPDGLTVVTSFYPLEYAARSVAGSGANVTNLTTPGVEAHDVELTPQQVAQLSDADVVIYLAGFQPAVDAAIEQARPAHVVEVSQFADLQVLHSDHETGHTADDGHDHDHDATDPHFWLDPMRLAAVSDALATELAAVAPNAAESFRVNATSARADLSALDQEFRDGLATCRRHEFVVAHAAFGYLAEAYGLEQVPVAGLSPDEEPSPGRIAEVQDLAREHGVTTIFFETLTSPAVAQSIATDLGLRTEVLDPLEGLTDQSGADDYPSAMRRNLAALRTANDCG